MKQKKAGLALALAAIFIGGGSESTLASQEITSSVSGGALSEDIEKVGQGTVFIEPGGLNINPVYTVDTSSHKFKIDGLDIRGSAEEVKNLKTFQIKVDSPNAQIAGNGGALVTVNGQLIDTFEIAAINGTPSNPISLNLGAVESQSSSPGGYFNNFTTTTKNSSDKIYVAGGTFEVKGLYDAGINTYVGSVDTNGYPSGVLLVNQLSMKGKSIAAAGTTFEKGVFNPSQVAIGEFADGLIKGVLSAMYNSAFTVGQNSNVLLNRIIKDTGRWGNQTSESFSAAMLIVGPQFLYQKNNDPQNGFLHADGDYGISIPGASDSTRVTCIRGSLFAFDLTSISDGAAALSAKQDGGTASAIDEVTIGDGIAGVYFHNAKVGETTIFKDVATLSINGNNITKSSTVADMGNNWTGDNLMFSSKLLTGTWKFAAGDIGNTTDMILSVSRSDVAVKTLFPKLSSGLAKMVDAIYTNGHNDTNSANAGLRFVTRAINNQYIGETDRALAAKVLEGAGQMAVAAGVPTITNNVVGNVSTLILDHANLMNAAPQPAYGSEPGLLGIWATPFYQYSDVDGLSAGKFENGYEINYGGAAIGLDYKVSEAFRLGLALSIGGGDSESQGDFLKTENDFDFFGLSLYGTYTDGAFGLTGDIGYTAIDNEIEQRIPTALGFGSKLKADADSDAFTIGLTGQYRFVASESMNITPHLGLRYTKISTDDATVKGDRAKLFRVDTDDQNLFQIPLGVTFSGDIETSRGWTVTPSADLGVLFTMGDTDVDSKARVIGTGYSGVTNADVVDSAAFTGKLGLKAASHNGLTLGLDYGILASGNQTDHSISGLLRFDF